jgi:hypothetical protein
MSPSHDPRACRPPVRPHSGSVNGGRACVRPHARSATSGRACVTSHARATRNGRACVRSHARSPRSCEACVKRHARFATSGSAGLMCEGSVVRARGVATRRGSDGPRITTGRGTSRSTALGRGTLRSTAMESATSRSTAAGRGTSRSTAAGRGTSRSTAPGQASHPALWAVIESFAAIRTFGGGKPRLSVAFYICARCTDHELRRRGSQRCVANVVLLVPATSQIRDNASLRGGLPAPNVQRPAKLLITAQRAAGLASADAWRDAPIYRPVAYRDAAMALIASEDRSW